MDEYGAKLNASQDDQVKAIVSHFKQRVIEGNLKFWAGRPRKRDENPKIAKNSDKLVADSLTEYKRSVGVALT